MHVLLLVLMWCTRDKIRKCSCRLCVDGDSEMVVDVERRSGERDGESE